MPFDQDFLLTDLRNNISIEKTCHYGNGGFTRLLVRRSQKWIQIRIWAPGPIFIPGFLHRIPAPVWMELELQSLNIECQMFLNAQRRCWSPKGTCYGFTNKRPLPRNKFLRTFHYCQPRHVQVWQGWFWQDWRCKPNRKGQGVWGLWPVRVQWLHDMEFLLKGSLPKLNFVISCGTLPLKRIRFPWVQPPTQDAILTTWICTSLEELNLHLSLASWVWVMSSKGYPATEQLEKKWTSPKYMDLVEKPKLLGQKFTEIFLQGVGDSQGKIKPWSSVDPAKRWAFSKIMGNGRCEHAKKNAFQISLLLRVFSLPKTYGRSWVNCRTWVNSRGQKKKKKKNNNNNNNNNKPSCSLQLSMTCPVS